MKSSDICPLCRSKIIATAPNHSLEDYINHFVDKYFSSEAKTARANLLKEHEEDKIKTITEAKKRVPRVPSPSSSSDSSLEILPEIQEIQDDNQRLRRLRLRLTFINETDEQIHPIDLITDDPRGDPIPEIEDEDERNIDNAYMDGHMQRMASYNS